MPWKIFSLTALVFGTAVQSLPQGGLGGLLWPKPGFPEFDPPEIDSPAIDGPDQNETDASTWATYRTEPASTATPSHVEHVTPSFRQLSLASSAVQLETSIVETPTLSHRTRTSRLPTPSPSEGHTTEASGRVTSTSSNNILPTSHPWSPPTELHQRHVHGDVWRVIGIAVIVVSVVGTTILLIVFFDQWWSFLCDVCGRRKTQRKNGKEELVPDWERGSWELRMEGNLPAYPSFGSPPPRQKEQVQQVTPQAQSPKNQHTGFAAWIIRSR